MKQAICYVCTYVFIVVGSSASLVSTTCSGQNVANYEAIPEPFLFLLREPAVHRALTLSPTQERQLVGLNQGLDKELLSSRNLKPEEARQRIEQVLASSRDRVTAILNDKQQQRLQQIGYRVRGITFVLIPKVARQLDLTTEQRKQIEEVTQATTKQVAKLQQEMQAKSISQSEANRLATEARKNQQSQILGQLKDDQRKRLIKLIGPMFDPRELGHVSFKAPEFGKATDWINSHGLQLSEMQGQVVVVHFFAFGCINCIRNYPWYREWYDKYSDQGVVMVGVHTPETQSEHRVDSLREKVREEKLQFPILVDNEKETWDGWGNSVWPSVYLIDKQGRLRYWWYGELNWQAAGGQQIMSQRIDELLAESYSTENTANR